MQPLATPVREARSPRWPAPCLEGRCALLLRCHSFHHGRGAHDDPLPSGPQVRISTGDARLSAATCERAEAKVRGRGSWVSSGVARMGAASPSLWGHQSPGSVGDCSANRRGDCACAVYMRAAPPHHVAFRSLGLPTPDRRCAPSIVRLRELRPAHPHRPRRGVPSAPERSVRSPRLQRRLPCSASTGRPGWGKGSGI